MRNQTKEKDINTLSFPESLSLFTIQVASMLYITLLYKITWGWFLADKFFEVGYWEILLGLIVVRFMILPTSTGTLSLRFDKKFGKLSFKEKLENTGGAVIVKTLFFGFLYIVHLVIS